MQWLELKIDTAPAGIEPVSALAEDLGITGLVIDDEGDFQDFLEHNHQYWDYVDEDLLASKKGLCRVTFYVPADEAGLGTVARMRLDLSELKKSRSDCGPLVMTMSRMDDEDWENNWKQYYKPMEIGERLLVVPQWESVPTQGRIPLVLDVCRRMKTSVGDTTALFGLFCGPFTLASHLRGTKLFMHMKRKPELVHEVMEYTYRNAVAMVDMYADAGMDVIAPVDPLISQISPEHFELYCADAIPSAGVTWCPMTGCAGKCPAPTIWWWPTSWQMSSSPWPLRCGPC